MSVVSVIIPAYGHAEYILETLESVFAQTYQDYEVIVVNDGSPDDTAVILRPLADSGRIRYFEIPNGGVAVARNFGISKAEGEFIALLDDDDLWPPDKLEWQVAALMMKDGDALAVGGAELPFGFGVTASSPKFDSTITELPLQGFFEGNPFCSPGQVLFRRSAHEGGVQFDPAIWGCDDLDFWIALAQKGKFLRSGRISLHYRIHESNASRDRLRMMVNARRVLEKRFPTLDPSQVQCCRNSGYRWLFDYLGKNLIWEARFSLISSKPRIIHGIHLIVTLLSCFLGTRSAAPKVFVLFKNEMKTAFITSIWRRLWKGHKSSS